MVVFPFCFGNLVGTVCGYFGGRLDSIVMRVVDVVSAFPFYVFIIALVFVVGEGTDGVYIAFGLTDWVVYARTTRSATLVARNLDWVAAVEGGGLSKARVLWRPHPGPRSSPRRSSTSTSDVLIVILAVVALCYLGLGIQPPSPDWGSMITDGQTYLSNTQWMAIFPGLAVVFTGVGGFTARGRPCGRAEAWMTPILELEDLVVEIRRHRRSFRVVDGVSTRS